MSDFQHSPMNRYRKRPVVIEAVQWHKHGDHPAVVALPENSPLQRDYDRERHGFVETLEGGHVVTPGDYIVTGTHREHYPVKPHIFEENYERADDEVEDASESLS